MLEIHERVDTNGYEKEISRINCEYLRIVESINGNSVNGYGIYSVDENGLTIYDFKSKDLNVTDGIVRTVLFKGLIGGINECNFEVTDSEKITDLIRLGFITKENMKINDINDFMNNCKKCKEMQ